MSINFDPKKSILPPAEVRYSETEPPAADSTFPGDPYGDPVAVRSEMDAIFGGVRRQKQLAAMQPKHMNNIVKGIEEDIDKITTLLGDHSPDPDQFMLKYKYYRKNLVERRANLVNALGSGLQPAEAKDILQRIEMIDDALRLVDRELAELRHEQSRMDAFENGE